MDLALLGIIAGSILATATVWYLSMCKTAAEGDYPGIPVLILGLWIVASALWTPYFFAIRLPGFFDLSIDRLIFLALLMVLGGGVMTGRVRLGENVSIEILMALFLLICLASMMQHGFREALPEFPSPWNVFSTGYLLPFLVFVYTKNFVLTEKDVALVFHLLFYLGVYLCVMAFFEFFGLRQFVFPRFINDPKVWLHLDRARGPFLNAAFNGLALNIGFVCGCYVLSRKRGVSAVVHGFFLLLFLPGVFFTQTRSVYLGFFISLAALLALYKSPTLKWKRYALPIALVLVGLMMASPKILSSDRRTGGILQAQEVEVRMTLIQRSLMMMGERPFVGVGFAQFIPESIKRFRGRIAIAGSYTEQVQHNHIIGMAVELGILGVGLYIAILILLFRRLYRLSDTFDETGYPSINFLILIAIIMAIYLTNNLFVEPAYCLFANGVFFIVSGIADGLYTKYRTSLV